MRAPERLEALKIFHDTPATLREELQARLDVSELVASGALDASQAALDRVAAARSRGHDLERVAKNVDHVQEVILALRE